MAGFEALPDWVFEGYPDFVGLGPGYTAAKAREAYEKRDPRVNGTMAEDYMRYGLMVATFLEKSDVNTLLTAPPPKSSFDGRFQERSGFLTDEEPEHQQPGPFRRREHRSQ